MIGLLLDEGLPRGAAADLSNAGWDVQHVVDLGLGAATDQAILLAAERDGRTVVTLDHDFPHLLFLEAAARPSVILLRVDGLDRAATVELLRSVVPKVVDDLRAGAMVSVDWSGARVRALPVR